MGQEKFPGTTQVEDNDKEAINRAVLDLLKKINLVSSDALSAEAVLTAAIEAETARAEAAEAALANDQVVTFNATKIVNLNAASPANTNRILVNTSNPPNTMGIFAIELLQSGATTTFLDAGWTSTTDAAASITNSILSTAATATRTRGVFYIPVDANGQIYYRVSTTSGVSVTILEIGYSKQNSWTLM